MKTKKAILREKYNITSNGYDQLYAEEQVEKYIIGIKAIKPRNKVLDNGCGTALFLEFLRNIKMLDKISYYICLDLSPGMLNKAKLRVKQLSLSTLVDIVEADAENLPLKDKAVDYTVSFTVISLLENPRRGLKEINRVTRKCAVVSSLKIAERHLTYSSRFGKYFGETSKDKIFVKCM